VGAGVYSALPLKNRDRLGHGVALRVLRIEVEI
jgi:hypothetical protein